VWLAARRYAYARGGRRGRCVIPGVKLRKSETDLVVDDEFIDTEKLIQVLFVLMPQKLLVLGDGDAGKAFAYSQKTRCLKLFQRIVEGHETNDDLDSLYSYCLDMAGSAWKLYEKWKAHPGFRGTRLRSIERENGEVASVPDGIVFPILGALSAFVNRGRRGWVFQPVERFDERELIDAAAQVYMEIADHNPQTMGKRQACYSALQRITDIYARLAAA
jgi:hypothetical protein